MTKRHKLCLELINVMKEDLVKWVNKETLKKPSDEQLKIQGEAVKYVANTLMTILVSVAPRPVTKIILGQIVERCDEACDIVEETNETRKKMETHKKEETL